MAEEIQDVRPRRFVSFDGTERALGSFARPDRYRHLFDLLARRAPAIPRGAGLSYGLASAGEGVVSVSSRRFNRLLGFDPERGTIDVEPGVTVGELFDAVVTRGWYPPVLPGHPSITVGGCVGFDVHGKSGGCFRSCVRELVVFHPSHGEVHCSADRDPELFELTIGGFGLTGFVTSVKLQLTPLPGKSMIRRRFPVENLHEAVEVMTRCRGVHDFAYSWNDLSTTGSSFGRGVVYAEAFDEAHLPDQRVARALSAESRRSLQVPLLNRHTIRLVNLAYRAVERTLGETRLSLSRGSFPMVGKESYFIAQGSRGFREYQILIPQQRFSRAAERIEAAIRQARTRCSLASLKILDSPPRLLRFSGSGIALAIDVPADGSDERLFRSLDELARETGSLINLSKDSRVPRDVVRDLFPDYEEFQSGIQALEAGRAFESALRRRVLG